MTTVTATDPGSGDFWTAVSSGSLPVRRCSHCTRTFVLPLPSCPYCGTEGPDVIESSGRGRLHSWVVVHIAFDEAFGADVPYCVAAIRLEEGARVYGRLEGLPFDELRPDLVVERVVQADGAAPLVFRPSDAGGSA
jgi:uncharacterized OB-fold protein